ncbi:MAG: DUF1211 domain-containing protein [Candidatus Omnitrophica bacterium]|nr:DUF1211 domain-containing protein [Candidatus Omnitrophota bacterium]MDE2221919.1 DUF1211 domain-containing protein [Candidatus Omnitrophota bacterium]
MDKNRVEAFSDGFFAIIITVMVLEMKAPHGTDLRALFPVFPVFLSYILSFMYIAIYWNNHHHLFKAVSHINGAVLWANSILLFWLSLIPFLSAWMGENHFSQVPVVLYGIDLLFAAVSYSFLVKALLAFHGKNSILAKAIGSDSKGNISIVLYILALFLSFVHPLIACLLYVGVGFLWLVPDQRIEKAIK